MDMNKSFVLKKEQRVPQWHVIDASDKVLGRLSTLVADILRGKDRPTYTAHVDSGDYVVVLNCDKIRLTGDKWASKIYMAYSGWRSGLKRRTAKELFDKDPTILVQKAVRGMLPKNKLNRQVIKKLKLYVGNEHPHQAQISGIKG